MSLEVISTSATLLTAVVIGATAVAALIQLRHLRTGNDIAAMLNYGATFRSEQFGHAQRLVVHRLGPAMNDPAFREYVASFVRDPSPREVEQDYEDVRLAAVQIGNLYKSWQFSSKRASSTRACSLTDTAASSPVCGADWQTSSPSRAQ